MLKRALQRVVLVLSGIAAALVLAELAVRAFDWAPEVHRLAPGAPGESAYTLSANPVLGYELRRSYPGNGDPFTGFATNSHGFRDRERTLERSPARRLVVLGDSVVAGHGIRALEHTLPARLERALLDWSAAQRVGGTRVSPPAEGPQPARHAVEGAPGGGVVPAADGVEVLNLGVGGYCTYGEVELLESRGIAYRPDAVLVVFVENDHDDLNSQLRDLQANPRPAWFEQLFHASALFRACAARVDAYGVARDPVRDHMDALGSDNVGRALRRLDALTRSRGIPVYLAIWPAFLHRAVTRERGGQVVADHTPLEVERLARSLGIPTLRLDAAFNIALEDGMEEAARRFTVGDGMHPSPEGTRVAAEALAAWLGPQVFRVPRSP